MLPGWVPAVQSLILPALHGLQIPTLGGQGTHRSTPRLSQEKSQAHSDLAKALHLKAGTTMDASFPHPLPFLSLFFPILRQGLTV